MVDTPPFISNSGAGSSKWRQCGCDLFSIWNTHMMSTGTAIPSLADNIFSSMYMTPIRTKYLTGSNPTNIWYTISTNSVDASYVFKYLTSWVRGRGSCCPICEIFKTRPCIILCSDTCPWLRTRRVLKLGRG